MDGSFVSIIGFSAATLTTISFLPQVVQTIRTRKTKDLSLGMYLAFTTGVLLWGIYGLLLNSLPMIAANVVTFILSSIILFLKIKNG